MPRLDQTGPRGEGPGTGRGLGPCEMSEERMICPECGACACNNCFAKQRCRFCGHPDRIPYTPEGFSAALKKKAKRVKMNKEAKEIKRLIQALEVEAIIPELTAARKATKKVYEIINGLDLQSELEFLGNTLDSVGYVGKPIGEQYLEANELLDKAGEIFLKVNNQIEDEVKALRAQESGAPLPVPESEEDVSRVTEEEEEAPAEEEKKEKK